MGRQKIIKIKGIRYKTINSCLAAFFECDKNEFDKIKGRWEWYDENGNLQSEDYQKALPKIRKMKVWGWVEGKEVIHYFIRKNATMNQIIGMFAHELGHMTRPWHRSIIEEKKAKKYEKVAIAAYELALEEIGGCQNQKGGKGK